MGILSYKKKSITNLLEIVVIMYLIFTDVHSSI